MRIVSKLPWWSHDSCESNFLSSAALPAESAGLTSARDDVRMSDDEGADDKQKDKEVKKKKVCVAVMNSDARLTLRCEILMKEWFISLVFSQSQPV